MSRTQIVLETELHQRARARATNLGISLAEYVRRLVAADLGNPGNTADISTIFDLGDSGGSDIANEKDRYVGAALNDERESTTNPVS